MRIVFSHVKGELRKAIDEIQLPVAIAASAAIREAGEVAQSDGRANIAAAGFGKRWQNGLLLELFPRSGKPSLRATAVIRHRILYSGVFQEGGTIFGEPLLWLPLPTVEGGRGRNRMTPKKFISRGGKLASVNRPGRRPLLVGKRAGDPRSVPLFVGVPSVTVRKRFQIYEIIHRVALRLGEFYAKNVRP